jgi:probable extracellular repeat, HAF family
MAVNASGHVVGFWSAGDVKAFWHEGSKATKMINLHPSKSPFTTSRAFGLNIHDVVVGTAYGTFLGSPFLGPTFDGHAMIWAKPDAASMKDLNDDLSPSLKADWTLNAAFAINDDGDIVGRALDKKIGKHHAFLLKGDGKFVDLGALKEDAADSSAAYAINECGDKPPAIDKVVGYTFTKKDSYYGFAWTEPSGMTDLGTLPGYAESYAKAINKKGEIVGAAGGLHTSIVFDGITCFGTCFTKSSGDIQPCGLVQRNRIERPQQADSRLSGI